MRQTQPPGGAFTVYFGRDVSGPAVRVDAEGYLFVHCLWNHSRNHQRQGWGGAMLAACVEDAKKFGLRGVAVLARESPWAAGRGVYLANGFEAVSTAPPDFELLVRRLKPRAAAPAFRGDWERKLARYGRGLTIVRSNQCPYIVKFAREIAESAERDYGYRPVTVELTSCRDAQDAPTPYAVFALIHNFDLSTPEGKVSALFAFITSLIFLPAQPTILLPMNGKNGRGEMFFFGDPNW